MYNYKIGYYSHEESEYTELQSEILYTKESLSDLITKVVCEVIKNTCITTVNPQESLNPSFQDIYDKVIELLINKYNFKKIEFEQIYEIFGWPSLYDKESWKDQRDANLNKITDKLINDGIIQIK